MAWIHLAGSLILDFVQRNWLFVTPDASEEGCRCFLWMWHSLQCQEGVLQQFKAMEINGKVPGEARLGLLHGKSTIAFRNLLEQASAGKPLRYVSDSGWCCCSNCCMQITHEKCCPLPYAAPGLFSPKPQSWLLWAEGETRTQSRARDQEHLCLSLWPASL